MNHLNSLEQKVTVLHYLDKRQWIPVFGIYWSRVISQENSIVTHARNGRSLLGDVWAGYQLLSSLACLSGLYVLGDRYIW